MQTLKQLERVRVLVIGAGQAGLSVGYHLSRHDVPFLILDANRRIGDAWRNRWDSLRLFTPARFDGLDGMPFPADPHAFPTKDEMADYLEAYAKRFNLPVRGGVQVESLSKRGNGYFVKAGEVAYEADHVVVAMANYQRPRVPAFAGSLRPDIVQMHSIDYRNPTQLRPGPVLLVGAGNSGSEIAVELARAGRQVWMSGRHTGEVPFRVGGFLGRRFLARFVFRFVFHRLLTVDTPLGRKARPAVLKQGGPLIRVRARDLDKLGVQRVGRTTGVRGGMPALADGSVLDVTNVIWCTGFQPGSSWIELPIFDEHGHPKQSRGIIDGEPGLYFVGRMFQYALSSSMIHGVGRDAEYVASAIAARTYGTLSRPAAAPPLAIAAG